jgi:hypothetical protein
MKHRLKGLGVFAEAGTKSFVGISQTTKNVNG